MKLTKTQKQHVFYILQSHLEDMKAYMANSHGNPDKEGFYRAASERTEALIPVFSGKEKIEIEEEEDFEDGDD